MSPQAQSTSSQTSDDDFTNRIRAGILQTLQPFVADGDGFSHVLYSTIRKIVNRAEPEQLIEVLRAAAGFVHTTEPYLKEYEQAEAERLSSDGGGNGNGQSPTGGDDEIREIDTGGSVGPSVLTDVLHEVKNEPTLRQSVSDRYEAEMAGHESSDGKIHEKSLQAVREG